MASINPNAPATTSAQYNAIASTVPMPTANAVTTTATGTPFSFGADGTATIGGSTGPAFTVTQPGAATATAASGAGAITVGGGGTTPAPGAQPAAPGSAAAAATTTTTAAGAPSKTTSGSGATETRLATAVSGFGKAERGETMKVSVGEGASFSFPAFNTSNKRNAAPEISWGDGWKKVQKDGLWYMEHTNGSKAVPALEYRMNTNPPGKVKTVKVANGWGKKFPDGTILVFDRNEGPYRLDPKGNKHEVELGTLKIGGIKVRVFEAAVVRTLEPNGKVTVFDSRGNTFAGTDRGRLSDVVSNANAGASATGGGKTEAGGPPGKTVGSGPTVDEAALATQIRAATEIARGLLEQVQGGKVDSAKLAELQAKLDALPAGIRQAMGAGAMVSTESQLTSVVEAGDAATATPPPPGSTVAGSGGGATTPPVAGRDANATTKKIGAGTKLSIAKELTSDLHGTQKRFGQLPGSVQEAIAEALGSTEGPAALAADQMVAIDHSGSITLVGGATAHLRRERRITGAGPGMDVAETIRPGRQPGGRQGEPLGTAKSGTVSTGGGTSGTNHSHAHDTVPTAPGASDTILVGDQTPSMQRAAILKPGATVQLEALRNYNGPYTWATLPKAARDLIMASQAYTAGFGAATGELQAAGEVDGNALVMIDGGTATFVGGLYAMNPNARPPVVQPPAGGGPSAAGHDHDAATNPANPVVPPAPPA